MPGVYFNYQHKQKCNFFLQSEEMEDHGDHDNESDEEHDEDRAHDSGAEASLTGFLFGNIDKKGQLIDDVLDEVRTPLQYSLTLWLCQN